MTPSRRHPADFPAGELAEPHVAVAAESRRARLAVGRRDVELRDDPAGVMRPIRLPRCSENQKLPSDPIVMIRGELPGCGRSNSLSPEPSGSMRPMRLPAASVNHSVPSGAMAIVVGPLPGLGSGNSLNRSGRASLRDCRGSR